MPVQYECDHQRRLIHLTISGAFTVADMVAVLQRQAADGAWPYAMLQDSTALTTLYTQPELEQIAGHVHALSATHGRRGPVAVVVGSDAAYGVGRMYEMTNENSWPFRVFRSHGAAETWLHARGW